MKTFAKFSWCQYVGTRNHLVPMEIAVDDIQDIVYWNSGLWIFTVYGKRYLVMSKIVFVKHD